jgi:hypothetical protein
VAPVAFVPFSRPHTFFFQQPLDSDPPVVRHWHAKSVHFHAHSLLFPNEYSLSCSLLQDTSEKTGDPVERAGDSDFDLHLTGEGRRFLVNLGMCFGFYSLSKNYSQIF